MEVRWSMRRTVIALVGIAGILMAGAGPLSPTVSAAEKDKAPKKVAKVQPSGGTIKVESTKASGAAIVAKSKACMGDAPKIEKVKPDEGRAGDKVLIVGKNFGKAGCLSAISFGPGNPAKFVQEDETRVSVTVPQGKKGMELLTITTDSGGDSKPFLVK